ncbi:MAG: N-acetylmuramoyl-L-alanine amidase [Lachnospiraceae bacterium]|nr:N-acetylmuramoyl-L-alanine amidase [Lachnospiraceae bacterium]
MKTRFLQTGVLLLFIGMLCGLGEAQEKVYAAPSMQVQYEAEIQGAEILRTEAQAGTDEKSKTQGIKANVPEKAGGAKTRVRQDSPVMGAVFEATKLPLVGIDPGHLGYTDERYFNTGAASIYGTMEYEWTMEIALLLKEELVKRGYDVYLLRNTNDQKEFPYTNGQRGVAANSMGCDVLVCIHWDSNEDTGWNGYHTIYKEKKNSENYRLAKTISDAYGEAVGEHVDKHSEPVPRRDLWELNVAGMPAVVVECGFSSNIRDAAWLEDEDNYGVIAAGIAEGIDRYFEEAP